MSASVVAISAREERGGAFRRPSARAAPSSVLHRYPVMVAPLDAAARAKEVPKRPAPMIANLSPSNDRESSALVSASGEALESCETMVDLSFQF